WRRRGCVCGALGTTAERQRQGTRDGDHRDPPGDGEAGHLYLFLGYRLAVLLLPCWYLGGTRQRQFHAEGCSATRLRFKFYPTIVQLHKSEGVGQADAGAAGAR